MKIPHGDWKDWEVYLEYVDTGAKIEEGPHTYLSAEEARRPTYIVRVHLEKNRPFRGVVKSPGIDEAGTGAGPFLSKAVPLRGWLIVNDRGEILDDAHEVYLEYLDKKRIPEHAPDDLSAERTGNRPMDVVYAEVDCEIPFRIVAKKPPGAVITHDTVISAIIDGRELGNSRLYHQVSDKTEVQHERWVDKHCGELYDMNYKFSSLLFMEDGPIPKELLYYGSVIVNLEAGTGGVPERTTDVYVDGNVLYRTQPSGVYSNYKRNHSIPKATVVFKYGTRAMLVKNGVISNTVGYQVDSSSPKPSKTSPTTSYGGKTFKPGPNPLTVIYDPEVHYDS
ncbi:uncharacterized protein LOC62_04G006529 [Vanrija pseudolonga]|uniref:Uncharacterized protein n=1 Tax=Vanrija pseudolonga TaxID=143232 RepID=A0AAF0YAJ2_9TREE|nr:hypothetical protein LOC62_04G006529 [Vanrija pseudolonga]